MANTRETMGDQATLDALINHTLTELYEDGVTALAAYALYGNTGLQRLTLPGATSIGAYALYGCSALTALVLPGGAVCTLAAANALDGTPVADGTGTIYVPAALLDAYRSASNWSVYAARFAAIEEADV